MDAYTQAGFDLRNAERERLKGKLQATITELEQQDADTYVWALETIDDDWASLPWVIQGHWCARANGTSGTSVDEVQDLRGCA